MKTIILDYYEKGQFEFSVDEYDRITISGIFINFDENKNILININKIIEMENEFWYLDNDGYRLENEELFKKSPWSIIEGNKIIKIVNRFFDYNYGKAIFNLGSWFRIGDEYNKNNRRKRNDNKENN